MSGNDAGLTVLTGRLAVFTTHERWVMRIMGRSTEW